jgi:hypothetical protein
MRLFKLLLHAMSYHSDTTCISKIKRFKKNERLPNDRLFAVESQVKGRSSKNRITIYFNRLIYRIEHFQFLWEMIDSVNGAYQHSNMVDPPALDYTM